ncbi:MAG: molybdopterin-dependent oxidoreductase [bacterium]
MGDGNNTVTLIIDGKQVTVPKGTSILEAASSAGIFIPHFCYHKDLPWEGTCRMCSVEVEKAPKLVPSCCNVAADGMVVHTDTEKVRQVRRSVLEFLLLNHPIDCPICDQAGECYLQNYYQLYGLYDSRFRLEDKVKRRKALSLGDMIILDRERCVLCTRCVRFCREVSRSEALGVYNRSVRCEIGTFRDEPIVDPYQGNLADVCPVGALTSKKFRFKRRVWFLDRTPSVCASCSTGCNIYIDHSNGVIYRFVPRRNPYVNRSWLCDEGRMSWERLQSGSRLVDPSRRIDHRFIPMPWDEALEMVAGRLMETVRLHGAAAVGAVASPAATNEENYLFKKFASEAIGTPNLDFRADEGHRTFDRMEDHLLRRLDRNPNTRGAMDAGMTPSEGGLDLDAMLDAAARGTVKALIILNQNVALKKAGASAALARTPFIVYLGEMNDETAAAAHVVLPIAAFTEKDGTFTNFQRRVQRIHKAVNPPGAAKNALDVIAALIRKTGGGVEKTDAASVFEKLASETPAFKGLDYGATGGEGVVLR